MRYSIIIIIIIIIVQIIQLNTSKKYTQILAHHKRYKQYQKRKIQSMSLQKYKKGQSNQETLLKSKLKIIDEHIRRRDNLPSTFFMHPQLLQHLKKDKVEITVSNQIFLQQPRSYLFSYERTVKFYFNYVGLPQDSRYCLKVQVSHTELDVYVQVDSKRSICYPVKGFKGIVIKQKQWSKVQFTLIAKRKQKLAVAKIQMNTIKIEHKVKVHGVPPQRRIAQEHIKQFLQQNKSQQKINQILQRRRQRTQSQKRSRTSSISKRSSHDNLQMHMFRTRSGFNQSTSIFRHSTPIIKQPEIQSTIMMKDLNVFQDIKEKYLKHIKKMSPEKSKQIMKYQKQYDKFKLQNLMNMAALINMAVFMSRVHKSAIVVSKKNMRNINKFVLVKKFVKHLIAAIKSRVPLKIRNILTTQYSLSMIASLQHNQSKKQAQKILINTFKKQMFKNDIIKATIKSQQFLQACKILQRKYRRFNQIFRIRFDILCKVKKIQFENQKQQAKYYKKYKKDCYKKSRTLRYFFTKNHKYLDELIKIKNQKKFVIPD